jgi:hypothetical protein
VDIHDDDVGDGLEHQLDRLLPVARRADDRAAAVDEHLTQQEVVVDDHDADRGLGQ